MSEQTKAEEINITDMSLADLIAICDHIYSSRLNRSLGYPRSGNDINIPYPIELAAKKEVNKRLGQINCAIKNQQP